MHRILLALTLLPDTPAAQDPTFERDVLDGLGSGDPPRIVQAAFDAGEHAMKQAVPALRKALKDVSEMDHDTARYPRAAVLDALIRLGGRAYARDLELCLDRYALPAAMILMSRAPRDCEDPLIQVFANKADQRTQFCWLAAGNMLVELRSKKFARLLLDRMRVIVNVAVIRVGDDIRRPNQTFVGGAGGGSTQYFYLRKNPPFALYQLGRAKMKDGIVVTKGHVPIYGHRLRPETRRNRIRLRSSWSNIDFTLHNLQWIAQLLDTEVEKLPMRAHVVETIFYTDGKGYVRDIGRIRDRVRGSHRALANRLRVARLIPADTKVRSEVEVRFFVSDYRPKGAAPLPELVSVKVYPRQDPGK